MNGKAAPGGRTISVFLADDNLIVREGVRALINRSPDLEVTGVAADYDEVIAGCAAQAPQVLVTDIRMPPSFRTEGIDAAKEVRKRHPGTGVVVLSQFDDPEYAIALLADGSAGYGYLLKDRVAEGNQLVDAIRSVAGGGTALDPTIVAALLQPVIAPGGLLPAEEELLALIAAGKPIKAIAVARKAPPEAVDAEVEAVFLKLAAGVSAGQQGAIQRLRLLHQAIVDREEQGETLSRLLPSGLAEKLRQESRPIGETERVTVTVLMSDIRSYSTIAEHADPEPARRPARHAPGRDEPGHPRRGRDRHAVRRRRRDGRLRRAVPAGRPCRPRGRGGGGHARAPGRDQRRVDERPACPPSGSASGCRAARRPRPCSGPRSGWNTPWWAIR